MFTVQSIDPSAEQVQIPRAQVLLRRGVQQPWVSFVETGRLAIGVLEGDVMVHQIGVLEGPCWLDASAVVLGLAHLVDALADSTLQLRSVSLIAFRQAIAAMPESARSVLTDVAMAHRRQTEFAISRLAKDAQARCAEWLLSHAQHAGQGLLAVQLEQRKCSIAAQLGITPETLSRVLRHLREQSLISGSGRQLFLNNPIALRSLAGS